MNMLEIAMSKRTALRKFHFDACALNNFCLNMKKTSQSNSVEEQRAFNYRFFFLQNFTKFPLK